MRNLVTLPRSASSLRAERHRLERELVGTSSRRARRILAIERRRVVVALAAIEERPS